MIQSMTGYGRGTAGKGINKITSLVKVVNGRYLDIKIRGIEIEPSDYNEIRNLLIEKLVRGTVQLTIEVENKNNLETLSFNKDRFEAIEGILIEVQKKYGRHLEMSDIINSNDLFYYSEPQSLDSKLLINSVTKACDEVNSMRKKEGGKLKSDLDGRLNILIKLLLKLEKQIPEETKKRAKKYRVRVGELAQDISIDESRIIQEIAILAEKADITEEVVRLKSHFDQFKSIIAKIDPVGKQLNFLIQEISREMNTIGSKTSSNDLINTIIIMKDELEKIREQTQNIL
ncbi:MAG: YicC/YloC family endoribonuclease [Candidatus Neomarinimicrobiota bacterium]|nr:YicC/YloC family endoribonuclease [Candidatus Neomarinimicrobiota bacterium]